MNPWLAVGATAALMSERSRTLLRRGLVYGIAGAITVGEAFTSAAKDAAQSAGNVASSAGNLASDLLAESQQARQRAPSKSSAARAKSRSAPAQRKSGGVEE